MALNDIASLLTTSQPVAGQTALPTPQPFTWGQGGQRLSPEELARQRAMADSMLAAGMDYSPVQSWTQGLARVAQGLVGGLQERHLNKAAEDNSAYSDRLAQALLGGDSSGAGSAMIDPYASPQVQGLAKMIYEREHPKPVNNDTVADYQFFSQFGPDAGKQFVDSKLDPIVNIPLPGGQVYVGPRSGMAQFVGGGGQGISPQPEAAKPSPAPARHGARPAGKTDEQLRAQALEAVRAGAPIDDVFARLKEWGVKP